MSSTDSPATSEVDPPAPQRFSRKVVVAVGIAIVAIVITLFLWYAMAALLLAFAGILVAIALRGMAEWVARKTKLRIGWALAAVVMTLVLSFVTVGSLLAPSIGEQIDDFTTKVPQAVATLERKLLSYQWGRSLLGVSAQTVAPAASPGNEQDPDPTVQAAEAITEASTTPPATAPSTSPTTAATSQPSNAGHIIGGAVEGPALMRAATRYAALLIQGIVATIVVLVVGIYLASNPELYERGFLRLLPVPRRKRVREVLGETALILRAWMTAQLIPMAAIGILTGAGLWLIGIRLWLTLGLLAALFNVIPNFGPLISFVPAILFALAEGPEKAMWVVALYIVAQHLEGYVLTPLVQSEAIKLPPAVTILVQLLMGLLMGGLGVLLAAPLTAAAIVIVRRLYVEDVLEKPGLK